jgi:putative FmdB family regulatory protein
MPLLQYKCPKCGKLFDELVKSFQDEVLCPDCKAVCVRNYSGEMLSATGKPTKHCSGHCATCGGCK